jgi:hypothetical protein
MLATTTTLDKRVVTNMFTTYDLSDNDLLQGQVLSELQEACLQNELAALAEEKLNLKYDTVNTLTYLQREAELQGQIGLVTYLVELSRQAKIALRTSANPEPLDRNDINDMTK